MESFNLIRGFITKDESQQIVKWVESINHTGDGANHHLSTLSKSLNGKSYIFDISNTHLTNYISKFQSISDVSHEKIPGFIGQIIERAAMRFGLSTDNVFLQVVDMQRGGRIDPHYDASVSGYISYKCNISVQSEDYDFFIDPKSLRIQETDLYGFEASLYKHWTNEFNSRRVLLSIGFIVKYEELDRSEADPRVRLSKRIEKYFQRHSNHEVHN